MARTTNEFGGGEIVPAIEAITGIQAPVMADFVNAGSTTSGTPTLSAADIVALGTITVRNEHGEARSIQNPKNNLKSNSGIERIPFNGIDELDTEYGSDLATTPSFNKAVHALSTGDSRIRFVGSGWEIATSGTIGTVIRTLTNNDYVEITFFGTALNILAFIDNTNVGYDWRATVDGGTEGGSLRPTNPSDVLKGNIKTNVILPVTSGLATGVHTVRIRNFNNGAGTDGFTLFGCEIINENAAITQQPGADFDGRVKLLDGTDLPIIPTGFSGETGARVLNYLTSGGQLKQIFTEANEELNTLAGASQYSVQWDNASGTITVPTSATRIKIITLGPGANGSGSVGGGGGGWGEVEYTRDSGNTSTLALTTIASSPGTKSSLSFSSTEISAGQSASGSSGGSGDVSSGAITGWSVDSPTIFTESGVGGIAGQLGGGGAGGAIGGGISGAGFTYVGRFPLDPTPFAPPGGTSQLLPEGAGGGGTSNGETHFGQVPGGGGAGQSNQSPGNGAPGRVYVLFGADAGLTITQTGGTTTETTGRDVGGPDEIFGTTNHANQEIIRRINFREFGANNAFATLPSTSGGATEAAFTLDDGTTTLTGVGVYVIPGTNSPGNYVSIGAIIAANQRSLTFTFVGTGLDVLWKKSGALINNFSVFVDGFDIGTISQTASFEGIFPICSGLAYGTHTVKFINDGNNENDAGITDFILYGPKKPEIPTLDAGSLELSDYNIMADYDRLSVSRSGGVSKGVLGKSPGREFLYIPHDTVIANRWGYANDATLPFGARAAITNATAVARYTFYGTGIEFFASSDATGLPTKGIGLILPGSSTEVRLDRTNFSITYQKIIDITAVTSTSITVSFGTNSTADVNAFIATDVITFDDASASTATVSSVNTSTGVITIDALPSGITATNNVVQIAQQGSSSTPVTVGQVEGSYFGRTTNSSFSVANGANPRIQVSGLPLGVTTARLFNTGNEVLRILGANIITPIHFQNDNLQVGSEGLNNLTIDPVVEEDEQQVLANLGEAKAWLSYNTTNLGTGNAGPNSTVLSSYNIAAVIQPSLSTSQIQVYFDKPFKDNTYVVSGVAEHTNGSAGTFVVDRRTAATDVIAKTGGSVQLVASINNAVFDAVFHGELIDE